MIKFFWLLNTPFQIFILKHKQNEQQYYLYSNHGKWKMGTPFFYNSEATYSEHVTNCAVQVTGFLQEKPHQSKQAPRAQSAGDNTIIKQ